MPVYAYQPNALNASAASCCSFETLQSLREPALEKCPTCGSPVKRIFAAFATLSGSTSLADASASGKRPANPLGRTGHACGPGCQH